MPSLFRFDEEGRNGPLALDGRYNGVRVVPRTSRWMAGDLVDDVHGQVEGACPVGEISGTAIRARQQHVSPAMESIKAEQDEWNRRQAAALAHIVEGYYCDGRVISTAPRGGIRRWWHARVAALRAWACARLCNCGDRE